MTKAITMVDKRLVISNKRKMKRHWTTVFTAFIIMTFINTVTTTNSYSLQPLTLKKFNKFSIINESLSTYQFTITSETEVADVGKTTLAIIKNLKGSPIEISYVNDSLSEILPHQDNIISYDVFTSKNLGQFTTIITTHHNDDDKPLAFLTQGLQLQEIQPTMTWVGGPVTPPDHKGTLRIDSEIDITIDDVGKCGPKSKPCYFLNCDSDERPEVCTNAKDDTGATIDILQCDTSLLIENSEDIALNKVTLTRDLDGDSTMAFNGNYKTTSTNMEVKFIKKEDIKANLSCSINSQEDQEEAKDCKVPVTEDDIPGSPFNILMVALADSVVTESFQVDFYDYAPEVQVLTADLIEVRWMAVKHESYKIYLDVDIPDAYHEVLLTCGENQKGLCKAYFVELESKSYITSVQPNNDKGDQNTVATVINMTTGCQNDNLPTEMTITKITAMSSGNNDFQVTLKAADDVHTEKTILAIINFEDQQQNASETIKSNQETLTFTQDERDLPFNIDPYVLFTEVNSYVIVTAHYNVPMDNAAGVAKVKTNFKEIIYPVANEVGNNDSLWIRVKMGDMALTVNGFSFEANSTNYLPKSGKIENPLLLCREAGVNLDDSPLNQCDQTQKLLQLIEMSLPSIVQLTYPEDSADLPSMIFTVEYQDKSTSMEATFYIDDKSVSLSSCELIPELSKVKKHCTIENLVLPNSSTFSILMVALEQEELVTESTSIDFEDYKTVAQALTHDLIEVRWNAEVEAQYKIFLDKDVSGAYSDISLNCGGDQMALCKSYFVGLQDSSYIAKVKKDEDGGDTNIVATTISMPSADQLPQIVITKFTNIGVTVEGKDNFIVTMKAAKTKIENIKKIMLSIITKDDQSQSASQTTYILEEDITITTTEQDFSFNIDYEVLSQAVHVIITAHGAEDNDDAIAVAEVSCTFKDIIYPAVNEVGTEASLWIRVRTGDMALEINGEDYDGDSTDYFPKPKDFQTPLLLCRKAGTNLDESDMLQCDNTQDLIALTEMERPSFVQLTYPEDSGTLPSMTFTADYKLKSTSMEASIYKENEFVSFSSCELISELSSTTKYCTTEKVELPDSSTFSILMVGLENEQVVTESTSIEFEDYETAAQALTHDLIEVRWNAEVEAQHNIFLDKDVSGGYSNISLNCGGDQMASCKAYFVGLQDSPYTTSVKKDGGDNNIVATNISMPSTDQLPQIVITKFTDIGVTVVNERSFIVTMKAAESKIENIKKIMLSIITKDDQSQSASQTTYILEEDITITTTEQDFSFIIDYEVLIQAVQVIITAHGAEDNDDAIAVAKVSCTFKDIIYPEVNEVGTEASLWIRVRTGDMALQINGEDYNANTTSYLPKPEHLQNPLLLCVKAGKNLEGSDMIQCDETQDLTELKELTTLNEIRLIYQDNDYSTPVMTITADYETSKKLEVAFYHEDKYISMSHCDIPSIDTKDMQNCTLENISLEDTIFSIITVTLGEDDKVLESTSVDFEDYRPNAVFIVQDVIQINWDATEETTYKLYLDKHVEPIWETTVDCGGETECSAMFLGLTDPQYTISLKKKEEGDLNILESIVNSTF